MKQLRLPCHITTLCAVASKLPLLCCTGSSYPQTPSWHHTTISHLTPTLCKTNLCRSPHITSHKYRPPHLQGCS
jgi:hypothetical protein